MARRGKWRALMHDPPLLVVMAKAPVCGAVKTRLAKEIGAVPATALNRALTAKLLREVANDPRFRTVLAISPDTALRTPFAAWSRNLLPLPLRERAGVGAYRLQRIEQARGGLGQRMQRIFERSGRGPLIIVGTDIPFIRRETIAAAFRLLRGSDAVFGRAEDGGYWLVGLRRRPRRLALFKGVRWSSQHALADTLKNLSAHRVAFAQTLFDIDTLADYRRYLRRH